MSLADARQLAAMKRGCEGKGEGRALGRCRCSTVRLIKVSARDPLPHDTFSYFILPGMLVINLQSSLKVLLGVQI